MEEAFIKGFVEGVEKVAAEPSGFMAKMKEKKEEEKEEKPKEKKEEKEEKEEKKEASFSFIKNKLGLGKQEGEVKTASAGDKLREKFGLTKKAEEKEEKPKEEESAFAAWKGTL
jgi:hypothetical protein